MDRHQKTRFILLLGFAWLFALNGPAIAYQVINLASSSQVSGILGTSHGGLGANASAFSGVVKASGGTFSASSVADSDIASNAAIGITKLATCGSGTVFHGGVANNSCSAVALASDVSGTLPLANLAGSGSTGNVLTWNGSSWASSAPSGGIGYGLYASRPAAGSAGKMYISSDGYVPFVDDGSAWHPYINGRVGTQPPAAATWTIVNAAGGTLADDKGSLLYSAPSLLSASANAPTACRAIPTTPYTLTMGFKGNAGPFNITGYCIALRDSATGRLVQYVGYFNASTWNWSFQNMTNVTTWSSNLFVESWPDWAINVPTMYYHFNDPGGAGNPTFKISVDGDYTNAVKVYSGTSRTAWTANPDQLCICIAPENTDARGTNSMRIFDWTVQ